MNPIVPKAQNQSSIAETSQPQASSPSQFSATTASQYQENVQNQADLVGRVTFVLALTFLIDAITELFRNIFGSFYEENAENADPAKKPLGLDIHNEATFLRLVNSATLKDADHETRKLLGISETNETEWNITAFETLKGFKLGYTYEDPDTGQIYETRYHGHPKITGYVLYQTH